MVRPDAVFPAFTLTGACIFSCVSLFFGYLFRRTASAEGFWAINKKGSYTISIELPLLKIKHTLWWRNAGEVINEIAAVVVGVEFNDKKLVAANSTAYEDQLWLVTVCRKKC